ncbi:Lrp/AsnC family transcriptional regulator [Candidatus Woesearchaeota archaeon]|nr:Lrp/AsnC family transcriptional regulator [Candidatus Woesearchaeota archaeon]
MKKVDDKDFKVLDVLTKYGRYSTQQIAKKTGIPISTVHNRMKKLERMGIIKGYQAVVDTELVGSIAAYVLISVMYHLPGGHVIDQEQLAKRVAKNELVEEVSIVTGTRDLIVRVRAASISDLNHFVIRYLRSIQGIDKTETAVVLKSV